MPQSARLRSQPADVPIVSSRARGWAHILVERYHRPPGEAHCQDDDVHTLHIALTPQPLPLLQVQGDRTHSGIYTKGDVSLAPAQMPVFARWEHDDHCLQVQLEARFLETVAVAADLNPDRLELCSEAQRRDPQMEAIASLLHTELTHDHPGETLYIDSLANLLAVHLLRHYTHTCPHLVANTGRLPEHHLRRVLDYINDHLDQPIKLADLAQLVGISPFHFSHLFKQSVGIAPYQYLLQQRIERAKRLLKQGDRSIIDIALLCGFSSHSHFSKHFRQVTGLTPKAYRAD